MPEEEDEEYEAPEESVSLVLPTFDEIKQTMTEFVASEQPDAEDEELSEDPVADYDYW